MRQTSTRFSYLSLHFNSWCVMSPPIGRLWLLQVHRSLFKVENQFPKEGFQIHPKTPEIRVDPHSITATFPTVMSLN